LNGLDVSANQITDHENVIPFYEKMPNLISLQTKNNPYCRNIRQVRRNLILTLPNLYYFDDRPVEEVDRLATIAWKERGVEGEREVRSEYAQAKHRKFTETCLKAAAMTKEKKAARKDAFKRMTAELKEEKSELFEKHQDLKREFHETKENDPMYTVLMNRIRGVEEKLSAEWYEGIKARGEDGAAAELLLPMKKRVGYSTYEPGSSKLTPATGEDKLAELRAMKELASSAK